MEYNYHFLVAIQSDSKMVPFIRYTANSFNIDLDPERRQISVPGGFRVELYGRGGDVSQFIGFANIISGFLGIHRILLIEKQVCDGRVDERSREYILGEGMPIPYHEK